MAEIEDWIKEQLKKGYKKEQIKEGLMKAGYPQNTIDSVDLLSKKQKNKNIIFFLGLIAVLIIIFIVGNYAWTHRSFREVSPSDESKKLFNSPTDIDSVENALFELVSEPVIVNDNGLVSIDMEFKRNNVSDLEERIVFYGLFNDLRIESNLNCEITPVGFICILNKEEEFYLRTSGRTDREVDFTIYQLMCRPECEEFKLYGGIVE